MARTEEQKKRRREVDAKYREANRERLNEYSNRYYHANFDKVRDIQKASDDRNAEKIKARKKAYHEQNRERCLKVKRAWKKANAEQVKAKNKAYNQSHPEVFRRAKAKRRAIERKAAIGDLDAISDWSTNLFSQKTVKCHWCGARTKPKECHIDHVVPLSKGGEHSVANLCVSCKRCNLMKSSKMPDAFNKTLAQPLLFV